MIYYLWRILIIKKGIIFDMGDTLVHNKNMTFISSISYLYDVSKNCKLDKKLFIEEAHNILNEIFKNRKFIEFKMSDYIKYLIDLYELEINYSIDDLEEQFAFRSCTIELIDNVKELLEYFKNKQYKLILLSNTSFSRNVVLKMLGDLSHYFDCIILSSETIFRKPHCNIFELGIKQLNMDKNNIYYIGNDYYCDVYGAIMSGIKSIWFNENKVKKDDNFPIKNYIEIHNYNDLINMNF